MRRRLAGLLLAAALAPSASTAELADRFPGPEDLSPLRLTGQVKVYTPENLWERIDGEAEIYRRFGLKEAAAAYFEHPADPDRSVEVSLFELDSLLSAFGLFASFRSPDAPLESLGNGGAVGEALAVFWHGSHFVHLYASGPPETREGDLRAAAVAVAAKLGPTAPRPEALRRFESTVDPATVRFLPDHLLGRSALPPGLEGRTREGLRVFVSTGSADVRASLAAYKKVLVGTREMAAPGRAILTGQDPDLGEVRLAAKSGVLAGALTPPDDVAAEALISRLLE